MSWWSGSTVYQVYIRSFADSNGDGVGDLGGIRNRLPYLQWLGVDALWITPFFPSPMADHGYDVADPRDVDPLFGDLAAFDALLADAHELGLRVIIDVVPNHTSDRRDWFVEALASPPRSAARDRYMFYPPGAGGRLPNDWRSVFGGPAWAPDATGDEYYLHLFAPEQPDLNWHNPEVVDDAERTLRFWFDRGADGVRIDVAHGLFKNEALAGEGPKIDAPIDSVFDRTAQKGTFDQPEVHEIFRRWRAVVAEYDPEPVLVGEVFLWNPERVALYVRPDELHLAFGFALMGQPWDATKTRTAITRCLGPDGRGANTTAWVLSNHDVPRQVTRFGGGDLGRRRARAAALLLLALPGTSFLYQGEELGLEDVPVPPEARQDPIWINTGGQQVGRDPCRVPLPWTPDADGAFGFTVGRPWLPMPEGGWGELSVATQRDDDSSMLALYRVALATRRASPALREGAFEWVEEASASVVAFTRRVAGETVTVLINMCEEALTVDPIDPSADLLLASNSDAVITNGAVTLPPDSAVWITSSAERRE